MGMDRDAVRQVSAWTHIAGLIALTVGAMLVNAALNAVNPFVPGAAPPGGRLAFGWAVAGFGGMMLQASIVGMLVSSGSSET